MSTRAKVDVFAYRDYRAFLRAYAARCEAEKAGFSAREFSREVGLRSPNYFTLVAEGARNLSPELAERFAEACGLRDDARDYFCALVAFNQGKTSAERAQLYEALQAFRRFRASHRLDAAHSAYHSEWYIPAVFELCARHDFTDDPRWVGQALLPSITAKQATKALSALEELGLVTRDASGRLRQAAAVVETADGPLGHQVVQFHRTMMERASEALDSVPRAEREIAALTLCISEKRMAELKRELEAFRQQLVVRYQADAAPERVVQVNFQMFPLSRKKDES
jgi:uncharacterized protein (TIGR02147 family)